MYTYEKALLGGRMYKQGAISLFALGVIIFNLLFLIVLKMTYGYAARDIEQFYLTFLMTLSGVFLLGGLFMLFIRPIARWILMAASAASFIGLFLRPHNPAGHLFYSAYLILSFLLGSLTIFFLMLPSLSKKFK